MVRPDPACGPISKACAFSYPILKISMELITVFAVVVAFLLISRDSKFDPFRSLVGLMCFTLGLTMVIGGAAALFHISATDSPPLLLIIAAGGFLLWCCKSLWRKTFKSGAGRGEEDKHRSGK